MRKTFSNFPSAGAGIALLILRLVVGTSSILEAGLMIARSHAQTPAANVRSRTGGGRRSGIDHWLPDGRLPAF